ncbi:MAG: hypothetical protein MPN21_25105 [Thermoanaerobaculia bacterium]|nr:hypothetical protein [Thermoanaerobaculia bacterium]
MPPLTSVTARHVALIALFAAATTTLVCCFVDAPWTAPVFAAAIVAFPIALMLLGAGNRRRRSVSGGVLWTLVLLSLLMAGSMAGLFLWRGEDALLLGLPAAAAAFILGLFLLPLALSTLGFAATFDPGADDQGDETP